MRAATTRTFAAVLALSTSACSLVFGGSRYTGGGDPDAATPDLDAPGEAPDVFVPIGVDANLGVDAPIDRDAPMGADAGPRSCTLTSECFTDEYCDATTNFCAPCDFDHDGLLHPECVPHTDGEAWDCDPMDPIRVRELPTVFAHTLRVFLGDPDVHVLYTGATGTHLTTFSPAGSPADVLLSAPAMDRFDARRVSATRVAVVGYDDTGLHRYELRDGGISFLGTRPYATLTPGYPGITPWGPITLVDGGEPRAYVGFGAMWTGETGRVVADIGGSVDGVAFTRGGYVATFYGMPPRPDTTRFASGSGCALLPNDTTNTNPFWMWAGDTRALATNNGLENFDVGSAAVGQLAVARVGTSIVAFAAIETGGGATRLAVNLAPCVDGSGNDCMFRVVSAVQIPVDGMAETTIAVFPTSDASMTFATTTSDAFLLGNLTCEDAGCTSVPSRISTKRIPAPAMDSREVALELRQAPAADRITIGLARASDTAIQVARFDVCIPTMD